MSGGNTAGKLRQLRARYARHAAQATARAQALSERAEAAQVQLGHRRRQLECARIARQRCLAVVKDTVALAGDLGRYGASLRTALDDDSIGVAVGRLDEGCADLARQACRAADGLMGRLQGECDGLRREVEGLRAQAAEAKAQAAAHRRRAQSLGV